MIVVALGSLIPLTKAQQPKPVPQFVLADCNVALVEEVEVAAQFPGVLVALNFKEGDSVVKDQVCLLYTSPSPRDVEESRMPSSA